LEQVQAEGVFFDAVLASEDFWAVGAVKHAKHQGLSIPDDLSIIGYNNSQLAQCCEPELTSVDNKVEELSKTTVQLLMQLCDGQEIPSRTVIQADLAVRETTGF